MLHNKTNPGWVAAAFCLFLFNTVSAQRATPKRNLIYVEAEHRKPFYSLNFEHIFHIRTKTKYSYKAGLALGHKSFYTPIGISAMRGKEAHHLVMDLTLAPYNVKYTKEQRGADHLWDTYLYAFPGIGYRYLPPNRGLNFKLIASPGVLLDIPSRHLLELNPKFTPTGFIAFGYSF